MPSRNSAQQLPEAWRLLVLFFSGGEGEGVIRMVAHIAKVRINRVRLPILNVVS